MNPIRGDRIPIWIADYVIGSYGTGAVMAVPAHDERDHAFAVKYALPIVHVVMMEDGGSFEAGSKLGCEDGVANDTAVQKSRAPVVKGMPSAHVRRTVTDWLA